MKKLIQNPYFWIVIIIIAGAGLRFYNLGFKSLWYDEAVSYWNAQGTVQEVVQHNVLRNSVPPTFNLMIHYISKFGNSEFMLRLIPCIAGILAIAAAFLLFKQFFGPAIACAPALLLALSPFQIQYSQVVRPYSMTMLTALLIVYFAYRITTEDKKINFIFYSIVLCFAVFLMYGLVFVIATTCIVFVIEVLRKKQFKKILPFTLSFVAPFISVCLVYNITLKHHMERASSGWGAENYLQYTYWDGVLSSLPTYLVFNTESIVRLSYASETKTLLIALMLLGIYACIKYKKFYPLIFAAIIFSISTALGLASLYPYAGCRQTIYLTVPVYLLAGMGFYHLFQNRSTKPFFYIALSVFAAYGIMQSVEQLQKESFQNVKPILSKLESMSKPGDEIFTNQMSIPAVYYYLDRSPEDAKILYQGKKGIQANFDTLETLTSQTKRLWLAFTFCDDKAEKEVLSILSNKNAKFQTFYESDSGLQKLILATFE